MSFAVYVLSSDQNVLDAEKAFVALSLFNILRYPFAMLPMLIGWLVHVSNLFCFLLWFLDYSLFHYGFYLVPFSLWFLGYSLFHYGF